jgi:hypothetical protein
MAEVVLLNAVTSDTTGSVSNFAGGEVTLRVELANPQGTERVYVGHKANGSSLGYSYTAIPRNLYTDGFNIDFNGATDVVGKVAGIQSGNSTTVTLSMNS